MDGNTTITVGLIFMMLGGVGAITSMINNRDAKKTQEGREYGVIVNKLENIERGQSKILERIEEVEDKVDNIDRRVTVLETKRIRKKIDTGE